MGTRSTIARKTQSGFTGVYHHWDGYPSGLGATLFQAFNGHFKRDLPAMLKYLIDEHPAGWNTINGVNFSKSPGFGNRIGPQCYCHGQRSEQGNTITEKNAGGCGCEYAYVFEVHNGKPIMHVLSSYRPEGGKMVGFFGWGDADSKWYAIGRVDLLAEEPDWDNIENTEPVRLF